MTTKGGAREALERSLDVIERDGDSTDRGRLEREDDREVPGRLRAQIRDNYPTDSSKKP